MKFFCFFGREKQKFAVVGRLNGQRWILWNGTLQFASAGPPDRIVTADGALNGWHGSRHQWRRMQHPSCRLNILSFVDLVERPEAALPDAPDYWANPRDIGPIFGPCLT